MTSNTLIRLRNFAILALIQVFIFGQIHLFGYATAYVYIIFLLKLPRLTSRNELLIWAFLFGLVVDMFGNTPGINACAATAMAFARNYILGIFTLKGFADDFTPGVQTIKWSGYAMYSGLCIALFCTVLYILELFTVQYPLTLLAGVAGSTMLTMLFTLVIECFTHRK